MGFILSKLRGKKPDRREELEKIDKELREIQRFQYDTELSQKRMIGRLLIFSSLAYLASAAGFYFFAPRGGTWIEKSLYILPFVIFPLLIWLLKKGLTWYYKQKMVNNTDKYKQLKIDKQRLLEDVMEFETFNNAKAILEKFDPNRLLPKYLAEQQKAQSLSPGMTPATQLQENLLRRRTIAAAAASPLSRNTAPTPQMRPILGTNTGQYMRQSMNPMPYPRPAIMPAGMTTPRPPAAQQFSIQRRVPAPGPSYMLPQAPTNPTVHNRGNGWMDKLVDYVVGDGPANRYALICRYCATHNGLATPQDFPYIGYRCVFCHQFNPPRQVRPAAEKLPMNTVLIEEMELSPAKTAQSSPRVTEDEGTTTDDEAKEKAPSSTRDMAAGDSETPKSTEKAETDTESEGQGHQNESRLPTSTSAENDSEQTAEDPTSPSALTSETLNAGTDSQDQPSDKHEETPLPRIIADTETDPCSEKVESINHEEIVSPVVGDKVPDSA